MAVATWQWQIWQWQKQSASPAVIATLDAALVRLSNSRYIISAISLSWSRAFHPVFGRAPLRSHPPMLMAPLLPALYCLTQALQGASAQHDTKWIINENPPLR